MDLLQRIQRHLGIKDGDVFYEVVNSGETAHFFPSVTRGPVNTAKAKKLLGWKPTPLDEAIRKTGTVFIECNDMTDNFRYLMMIVVIKTASFSHLCSTGSCQLSEKQFIKLIVFLSF